MIWDVILTPADKKLLRLKKKGKGLNLSLIVLKSVTPPSATSSFTPSSCSISLKASHIGATDSIQIPPLVHVTSLLLQESWLCCGISWLSWSQSSSTCPARPPSLLTPASGGAVVLGDVRELRPNPIPRRAPPCWHWGNPAECTQWHVDVVFAAFLQRETKALCSLCYRGEEPAGASSSACKGWPPQVPTTLSW